MNRKRHRSPSLSPSASASASADESTKLCLICEACPRDTEIECYYAFILDPTEEIADADTNTNDHGFIPLNTHPVIRFEGLDTVTFCVFKSTLYIFETDWMSPADKFYSDLPKEFHHSAPKRSISDIHHRIAAIPVTKSAYSFDLPQSDSSSKTVVVQKSELQKLPDMVGAKVDGDAVVTPDGKILVFSRLITSDFAFLPELVEFELYDPDTGVWSKLPQLRHPDYGGNLRILGSGFLTRFAFFISTCIGNFVLDLDENEKCWKQHHLLPREVAKFYLVGEEEVCLTDCDVKSAREWATVSVYPAVSSFPQYVMDSVFERMFGRVTRLLALLDTADGYFSFCIAQVVLHNTSPLFILDVFRGRHDEEELQLGKKKLITTKVRSLKFTPLLEDLDELIICYGLFGVQFNC